MGRGCAPNFMIKGQVKKKTHCCKPQVFLSILFPQTVCCNRKGTKFVAVDDDKNTMYNPCQLLKGKKWKKNVNAIISPETKYS